MHEQFNLEQTQPVTTLTLLRPHSSAQQGTLLDLGAERAALAGQVIVENQRRPTGAARGPLQPGEGQARAIQIHLPRLSLVQAASDQTTTTVPKGMLLQPHEGDGLEPFCSRRLGSVHVVQAASAANPAKRTIEGQ